MKIKIIIGGTLIDGTGKEPIENAVVIIEGNRIMSICKKNDLTPTVKNNAEIIEVEGKIIIPGLVESHAHIFMNGEMIDEFASFPINNNVLSMTMKSIPRLKRLLEMGITTYRDGGSGWGWFEVALRDAINNGTIIGPRYSTTGYHITVTGGHGFYLPPWLSRYSEIHNEQSGMVANGPDEWRKAARLNIYNGTDNIKVVASGCVIDSNVVTTASPPTLEELTAAIDEAHKMNKKAIAHASGKIAIRKSIKAGVDSIVHGFFMDEECAEIIVKNNVFLEPTNLILKMIIEKGKGKLPDWMIDKASEAWKDRKNNFKMYLEKGVKISFGSDAGVPFVPHGDNAGELKILVELGMSAMDAIIAATRTGAEALGIESQVGSIEEGKIADILIINGDPLEDISLLSMEEKIQMVIKEGEVIICR